MRPSPLILNAFANLLWFTIWIALILLWFTPLVLLMLAGAWAANAIGLSYALTPFLVGAPLALLYALGSYKLIGHLIEKANGQ
jgi:hypothetical protein